METEKIKSTYKKAKTHKKLVFFTDKFALVLVVVSVCIIIASFILSSRSVVKFVAGAEKEASLDTQQKFIIRPRLEIEDKDAFYNLKAEKGYYETEDRVIFKNADVDSSLGTLQADEIKMENNFNDITVTENPKLVVYPDAIKTE